MENSNVDITKTDKKNNSLIIITTIINCFNFSNRKENIWL